MSEINPYAGSRMYRHEYVIQDPFSRYITTNYDVTDIDVKNGIMELIKMGRYGIEMTTELVDRVMAVQVTERRVERLRLEQVRVANLPAREPDVVYYMLLGSRIKIGTTTNVKSRLSAVNAEELLATEPGDRTLEAQRHREFASLRTHLEWFRFEDPLVGFLDLLRGDTKVSQRYDELRAGSSGP